MCSLLFVLALLAPVSSPASVTATRLDGDPIAGELREWHDSKLVIATPKGVESVATDELVDLRWPTPPPTIAEEQTLGLVELIDGTILPANEITIAEGRLSMTLATGTGEPKPLSVPVQRVAAVRLKSLTTTAAEQWQDIREQGLASDVLLVLKRGGESLDYVEGVLGDISPEKIEFKLDGEPLRLDRAKVAGFIYYRRDQAAQPEPQCILHGRNGLRASATSVRLKENSLGVTTQSGARFDWPLSEIEFADFSAGKVRYLSDIEQSTVRWTPLVALPAAASVAAEYGQPRRDQSAYGGSLSLLFRDANSFEPEAHLRSFSKGLALRSRTEMAYRLPTGFGRFIATAGIEPATSTTGNVQLAIYGDDRPLYEAAISGDEPPREIELDIRNVKRLKVVVDFGQNLDTGDWLNLCDARLVK